MQATQQIFSAAPATTPGMADLFSTLDIRRRPVLSYDNFSLR